MRRKGTTGRGQAAGQDSGPAGPGHGGGRGAGPADRGHGGGRDVEAVLDELYVTRPSEFVARREELAVAARTAGRAEDARRIHAARRPTTAAWAANLLLRSAPRESGQFLELGRELREAYRTLDAPGWRELSAQRRRVVSALSRETAGLAREAGLRLSAAVLQEVDSTLRAVLADPEAADRWATGRLVTALAPPSGLPSAAAPGSGGGAAGAPAPRAAQRRTRDELAERRRLREEELTRARQAAEASEARLGERLSEHADAEESLRRARTRHDEAEQQVTAAARHLDAAREEREQAAHERDAAEERSQSAADALTRARREAREAAKKAERLAGRSRRG